MINAKYPNGSEYTLKPIEENSGVMEFYINDELHGIICMSDIVNLIENEKK